MIRQLSFLDVAEPEKDVWSAERSAVRHHSLRVSAEMEVGRRRYSSDDFDVLALVALDRRLIAYYALADTHNDCIALRVPGVRYGDGGVKCRYFEDAKFEFALDSVLMRQRQEALFAS